MPSSTDFMNKLNEIRDRIVDTNGKLDTINTTLNSKLTDIKNATDQVRTAVQQVDTTLTTGLNSLINLGNYTNQALFQNAKQNETIICILEHISRNTCAILNEAHVQTGLQRSIEKSTTLLADLYGATHAEAMLAHQKAAELKKQIEECCPPPPPKPACTYEPCEAPRPLGEPRPERPLPGEHRPPR